MNQPENTIPFSLEKWKEGYEVVCRDGTVPSELHYFETLNTPYPLVGLENGCYFCRGLDGMYYKDITSRFDIFLRHKMEKWYRRAYWDGNDLFYIGPSRSKCAQEFADSFLDTYFDKRKWAGPVEEFEVMAREG